MDRREFDLLRVCARTHLDERGNRTVSRLLDSDLDWDRVREMAAVHFVQPLLYKTLVDFFAPQVPEPVLADLRQFYKMSAMNNLRLSSELARVVNLFAERKVRALAFKGPVLATTAYRSLGLRWCGDIDLLVSDDDYLAAEEILRNDGYALPQKARALPPAQRRFHLYITRQYPFAKAGRLFIDLHTGIMPAGYMFPLSLDRLWERSHLIEVAGQKVRDCEPEDVLLILCYQGVKNQWERLKHVCDVAELLRSYPELDWDVILERAQSMRGERILLLGLHLAHSISGAPLPNRVLEIIEADTTVAELAEHVFQLLVTERKTGVDLSWRFRLHMKVHNHWSTRLRYGAYTIARRLEERIERATLANPLLKHAA